MIASTPPGAEPVERDAVFTPLGIRFWDPASNAPAGDGLDVRAWPEGSPSLERVSFRTRSGLHSFRDLPGLHGVEHPGGEGTADGSPFLRRFVVQAIDPNGRFLPAVFVVELPLGYRGPYLSTPGTSPPGGAPPGFFLFSAPTRPVPSGFAAVRVCLEDLASGEPAAYSVAEVEIDGRSWYGIADGRGRLVVLVPYPVVLHPFGTSPPAGPAVPLEEQRWPFRLRIRYQPAVVEATPGAVAPLLRSIFAQGPASLWASESGSPSTELSGEIAYGSDWIGRTDDGPVLLVGPSGGSP